METGRIRYPICLNRVIQVVCVTNFWPATLCNAMRWVLAGNPVNCTLILLTRE